ncbi:MAG: GNAT family N-acetyltransferase [Acidimicrobiales bacterium]
MPVTVRAVASADDLQSFLQLTSRLHRKEPCWIPPIPEMYARVLSREANPYFQHADAECFIAWQDGEAVGHIVAHIDHALNEYQRNRWGLFGFFEAADDQAVATALVDAAAGWLGDRGRDRMVGPLQFSTKEDPGLLIEGCDRRPVVLQPWHPHHYRRLLEGAGLTKAKDVLWREVVVDGLPPEVLARASLWAPPITTRQGVTIRSPGTETMADDLERVLRFMPSMFGSDWGYVPWTDAELAGGLGMAMSLAGPGTLLAELDRELIGASMLVPDLRQTLHNDDGRLARSDGPIDQARLMFMAVSPEHRRLGIMPALMSLHLADARRRGLRRMVIGWSYEDNELVNAGMARLGIEVALRHRIYEKVLSPSAPSEPSEPAPADPTASAYTTDSLTPSRPR